MDFSPLEREADAYLQKCAGYMSGDPENLGQVATQTLGYATPVLGTFMTGRDAYNNFRNGEILSGLFNTAMTIGSGALDVASLFGIGLAGRAAYGAAKGGMAAAKGGMALARGARAARAGMQAGRASLRATQAARLGARGVRAARFATAGKAAGPSIGYGITQIGNAMAGPEQPGFDYGKYDYTSATGNKYEYDWDTGHYYNNGMRVGAQNSIWSQPYQQPQQVQPQQPQFDADATFNSSFGNTNK